MVQLIKKSFVLISLLTLFSCTNDSQNKVIFIEDLDTLKETSSGQVIGFKHKNNSSKVITMVGDGELQEGEIWEGIMCAAHYKLNNLCEFF